MPETQYNRDVTTRILLAEGAKDETEVSHVETQTSQGEQKRSFVAEMSPWNPVYKGTEGFWENFTKPFPMLVSPIILFVFFINAFNTIWYLPSNKVTDTIPGLSFLEQLLPRFSCSHHIISLLLVLAIQMLLPLSVVSLASLPQDLFSISVLAKDPNGIKEFMSRNFVFGLLFSHGFSNSPVSWVSLTPSVNNLLGSSFLIYSNSCRIGPVFCLGLINFGSSVGSNSAYAYLLDCHRSRAPEAFAAIGILRNVVAFGFLLYHPHLFFLMCSFINDWVAAQGPEKTFITIAGLLTAFHLLTIPM